MKDPYLEQTDAFLRHRIAKFHLEEHTADKNRETQRWGARRDKRDKDTHTCVASLSRGELARSMARIATSRIVLLHCASHLSVMIASTSPTGSSLATLVAVASVLQDFLCVGHAFR